ncbi:MAG: DUF1566 domain-containing protein [Gammaproteobacteria bacterium]|nr:DUF1566 domain-containing protein [Gammaproteobacteria bacterium]
MSAILRPQNPYVGPRPFKTGETLFGRDREIMDLLDLLIAERIVLLYSPSGAGKTSLIQAGLIPELEEEGFQVLPVMRVSLEPPPEQLAELPAGWNRYVLSLLLSLEEGLPKEEQLSLVELAGMTLAEYLERLRHFDSAQCDTAEGRSNIKDSSRMTQDPSDGTSYSPVTLSGVEVPVTSGRVVLIFDQFEEILTLDPTDRAIKTEFFAQVGAALRHPDRWVLFAMREEFPAGLDPYLRPVPTRLSTTFRLELLGEAAAREAMQEPARQAGIPFSEDAATKLINDLRQVRVQQADGSMTERPGLYVEPVQLQVVCHRLWNHLPDGTAEIRAADIQEAGDVNSALEGYYADRLQVAARATDIRERGIREWFGKHLITEQGIRGQVLRGVEQSQGLENRAIAPLVDAHLVRAENRRGATWYELAHDRLVEPVRKNNAAWFLKHLSTLQRQTALWQEQGRSQGLLLRDEALEEAEIWAVEHQDELIPIEQEFLTACREARTQARRERRKNRFIQGLAIVATICLVVALYFFVQANKQRKEAERRSFVSVAQSLVAYALQQSAADDREQAALLARQAYFLNQAYQGHVIEQIDNVLRLILHPPDSEQSPDINVSVAALVEQVCQKVKHKLTLTPEEWEGFVGRDIPYEACPELHEPQATSRIHLRSKKMTTTDAPALSLNLYEKDSWWYPKRYVDNDFKDRGEVVVDHATGLMWQKSGSKAGLTYEEARQYVEELNHENFAGYDDWRLPTIPELMSLLESKEQSNELYIDPIFDVTQIWVWSADERPVKGEGSSGSAWLVYFNLGGVGWLILNGVNYVRVVRS